MAVIQATFALYRDAGKDTLKALPRSLLALLFLLLAGAGEMMAGVALGGTGMAGGFVMGIIDALLCGWYLALVHILIGQNRNLRTSDLQENAGSLFFEVITVGFVFGIPRLILTLVAPQIVLPYVLIVALVFNPIPEMVQQERGDAMGLIGKAAEFMKDNWPEWLAGHVLIFGGLIALVQALTGSVWFLVPSIVGLYGPWMGFIGLGSIGLALLGLGPVGIAMAAFVLIGGHGVMLFRAALYKRLARSSRRSRAGQSRIG